MWGFRFFHEMFPPHFLDTKIIYGKFPGYKNFYAKKLPKKFYEWKKAETITFQKSPIIKGKSRFC